MKTKGPKVILFDIETAPILGYSWSLHETEVLEVVRPSYLLCFAWKELDTGTTNCLSLRNFAKHGKNNDGEKQLVSAMWKLLNSVDVVIAHNGDAFDAKRANAFFMRHGLKPPQRYKTIDTLKEYKKVAKNDSHKLDFLGKDLGLGRKVHTGGISLWMGCMNGEAKAWQKMETYCKQDVRLLEAVYKDIRPWMKAHPNMSVLIGRDGCPKCGHTVLIKSKERLTATGWALQYQCKGCGSYCTRRWAKGEKPEAAEYRLP